MPTPFTHFHLSTEADADEKAQIDADNKRMSEYIQNQIGDEVGHQDIGGVRWSVRSNGTWITKDPNDPANKILIYNPSTMRNLPGPGQGVFLGGDQGEQAVNLRHNLATNYGGGNPMTRQGWDKNPSLRQPNYANYGQLLAEQRFLNTFKNPASSNERNAIFQSASAADLLRDIEKNYKLSNGKAGLNKLQQYGQQFKTETDYKNFGNWILSGGPFGGAFKDAKPDPQRDAYLKVIRDIVQLQKLGVNVSNMQLTGDRETDQLIGTVKSAINAIPWLGPETELGKAIANGGADLGKAILNGQFDPDALKSIVPYQKLQLERENYARMKGGYQSGTFYDDDTVARVNRGTKDMEDTAHMDADSSVAEKAYIMGEPGEEQPSEETPKAAPGDGTVKKALPATPQKAPIQTTTTGGTQGTGDGQKKGGTLGVTPTATTGKMSDQETIDRAQIVNTLKQQPGREKEQINLDSPEVTQIYNQQKGITPAPATTTTGGEQKTDQQQQQQQKTQEQKKTEDQQTVSPAAAAMLGIGGPGITKPEPTGPITPANRPDAHATPDTSNMFTATQAGVEPGTDIQNITTNRAAEVARLADPNWRPQKAPINQKIDEIVGQVTNPQKPAHLKIASAPLVQAAGQAGGGAATVTPTPTAATDAQSAVQNVTTQRASDAANAPGGENLINAVPGAMRRLVMPYGIPGVSLPSYDEERQFQQQQELEQQERARKQLEGTIPQDAAMGAPLGAPDYAPLHLHHQGHVDSLQPGTPFFWRDHAGAYVKT